ncbi:MAG: energy-coupling factor ABC transporter permease [Clostridium sp.]|nr:energy-coupling factor ABC transporter permease [Clostridium sp.]
MHMADALLSPAVAGTLYACSAAAAGYSVKKVRLEEEPRKIPVMGVMGAFVFAAQMINFTIPGTGSSGHLCGGMLLAALLGPGASFLTMIGVLLIQCLLFADGGILALGANIWNMAFFGCFVGGGLIWRRFLRNGATRPRIIAASLTGCIVTLQLGAFSVTLETLVSGVTELPFTVFLAFMQPIHLAIGLVEGLITSAVLLFVWEARPELLNLTVPARREKKGKLSFGRTLAVLAAAAVLVGGGLSLAASSFPDGLEWSIEKITGSTELERNADDTAVEASAPQTGGAYAAAAKIQETTALLPDYAFPDSDTVLGTSFSGIVGGFAVVAFSVACCYLFRFFQRKRRSE